MLHLPTDQTRLQRDALQSFLNAGLTMYEPCDCGSQVRHNNGGNYHSITSFRMDAGKCWRSSTFTGDYGPPEDWKEVGFGEAVNEIADLTAKGWSH